MHRMGIPGVQAPTRLGRYELLARLATGGMGEIFLARLEGAAGFEKLFVVKRILPHLADDARFRQMLIAEARVTSKLSHANICQIYELGETDGQLYIVMEYMEGVTLLPMLRKQSKEMGTLDFGFIGGLIQQTCDALHYAHEMRDRGGEGIGIVHRDVTPSNIFLTESGVVKILDFGIAKVKDASANTQTGAVKGKYAYMAPEQLRGHQVDRRVDVFAIGICVYEMIALRRLFQRKTDYLTFRAVMEQPIPDIRRYRADVPDALAAALSKSLDRDPANRFDTARQFGTAVLDALTGVKRPWTQGEIGDFVRLEFADELRKRSEQVMLAVHRPNAGSRSTMPLIAQEDATQPGVYEDDDDEFPSVESTISEGPLDIKAINPPRDPKEFAGQNTPPPFGNETSTSGVSLQSLDPPPATSMPHAQMMAPRPSRSMVWPLLAIAMVGITGGALFLVWKQMQQQQPPAVVNITSSPDNRADSNRPTPGQGSDAAPDKLSDKTPDRLPDKLPDKTPVRPKGDPYKAAIQVHRPAINKCAQDHGAPPTGVKVVITVSTNGHAKSVSLEPATLNSTPLGMCIKNVLSAAAFPSSKDEKQVAVTLTAS